METYLLTLWNLFGYAIAAAVAVSCSRMVRDGRIRQVFNRIPAEVNGWALMNLFTLMGYALTHHGYLTTWFSSYAAVATAQSVLYCLDVVMKPPAPR